MKTILFIDSNVTDYSTLMAGLASDVEVCILNAAEDGVLQMAQYLNGRSDLDSIQIISHGSSGALSLGSTSLNNDNIATYSDALAQIGASLSETGDILLYGCDVAQGDSGLSFIDQLTTATGADVAASTDSTGSAALGGDWVLEANTGAIESTSPFDATAVQNYSNVLSTTIDTTLNGIQTSVGYFGEPNTATYGQTFKAPSVTDNLLQSFSFWVNPNAAGTTIFKAYLGEWNGSFAANILWSSPSATTLATTGMQEVAITGINQALDSTKTYVFFFSASQVYNGVSDGSSWGFDNLNPYSGGDFVFYNNSNNFDLLTTLAWSMTGGWGDTEFKAVFGSSNTAPTLTTITALSGTEDIQQAITFANLTAVANEADSDGSVVAFVVKAVSSGTLLIGSSAETAAAWVAGTNDVINNSGNHTAFWTGASNANGSLNAFTVVAKDNLGAVSASPVQVTVNAAAVNDAASITGTATGAVTEDTNTQVTGTLAVSDVDTGEAVFNTTPTVAASYGTFAINSAGAWSYELDNTNSTVNALAAGAALTDNITVASVDGTTKQIAINITGANDGASITGTTTGAVTEDSGAQVTGSLTVNDVDTGEAVFNTTPTVAASYGTFAINSAGAWTYDLDNTNSTVNALVAGAPLTDSITVASIDGTATQVITINITGANDAAVITGTATGAVTEDTNTQVTGTLAVSDVDTGEALFNTTPTVAALYGTFAINSAGAWTYDLDNTNSTVNALAAGAPLTDSITVASIDGTATQVITINITGANDAAIITGTATGAVTEDSGAQVTGSLTVNDVDTGEALFNTTPTVAALYGTFAIDSAGAWTYDLNNSDATVNALAAGAALTDSITIASVDGSATQVITINITGANDAASITGTSTATLSETDAVQSATGTLTASDPDSSNLFVVQNGVTGSNGYGSFSITDAGVWTYTMNNAHNEFVGGTNYTDSITVTTADGTPQLITVTITGSNDAAVISGLTTGSVNEAGGVANNVLGSPTAMGILTDTDVDNPANTFHAVAANTVSTGGYGTYQVSDTGIWTYTLNNNNTSVEALNAGNTLTDHITVTTVDGTAQVVSIIVNGVNDAAVIEGATIGSVTEDAVPNTTTGTLSVSDVDSAASFQAVAVATTSTQGYGSYTIDASGHWVYGLNNSNATVNALNTGGVLSDSFTVFSADGTAKVVNINIDGHTDAVALAPTDIQWNAVTPSNNLPNANAILASLSTVDPDTTSGFSYALLAGSSSGFSVTPAGNVSRASVMAQNQTYTLNIKTTDPTLLSYTETFTIKTGSNSDNTLTGTSGDDIFYGLNGEDTISGGTGNDILFGQTDDDVLIGGAGADVLNGGTGKDTASYHTATAGVTADLANRLNNTGDAAGDTYVSIENLMGSDFADKLTGNSSANQISGGNGNDTILGFAGEDFVNGGNGTDTIALTATSTDLNHANNGQITNVEAISASTAGSGVLIDLHNQSEGFTITGSAFADTIIASNGNDWITGGNGADIIDLGTHNGTDHVIFNTTSEFGDTICNFDTDRDSIDFSGVLKTLLNDGLNSGSIAWGTSASGNNSNTSVDLNNIEALYLAGTTNDGVASGSLTNANLVATEFNAEFNINVTNGENTLLVINDNTANSNKATVWMYTESGGAEIQASELQLIGVINANHSVTTNDFHLV